ncbi:hypothetical protein [Neorhizobium galegae]|uniref:hypothetical protein n=1 Tax=Neorhizobium galegae TaxID=399 RepID=UPI0006215C17|nr:hypothetical protein [Neorhizobium galegae]CDZ58399.1 Hypothetical protein NGAL_HAMBI2566_29580 [Neorhizobium galegae bv. orientalis]KAB1124924.1 hypothetical protein F4V90_15265 [Neorhizobium galegae]MCQ1572005.1 hypothetical protein [Neorhizobium galegae]MCQ1809771.1 hypothetical protein [Neorhizobium galegae]MCQ1836504.1 hypothetical protein [Neorhizobium galegae]
MNKAFALAVLMSAATMGTAAYARDMGMTAKPAGDVAIVYTDPEIDNSAKRLDVPDSIIHPSQAMVQKAQAEVKADRALRADLLSQNVELNNVVAIDTAADGSRIVYVR